MGDIRIVGAVSSRWRPSGPAGSRLILRSLLATVVLASTLVFVGAATVAPGVDQPFGPRFATNTTGTIRFVSNTLLTCPASANCTAAQTGGSGAWANNNFSMVNVDVDNVGSTANSSSAELTLPPGSSVVFAGLYWGAVSGSGQRDEVELDTPQTAGYVYSTVTASSLYATSQTYQGFADITSTVQTAGAGVYTVADVRARTGRGRHAGWSMVVVLEDPSLPFRNLTVFDGWNQVRSGENQDIAISGFLAPPTGPINAEIGLIAYEGDNRYSGDFAQLDGTNLSDAANPSTNFFNSTITTGGVANGGRSPSYVDQLGYDANIVQTTGLVAPSSTSATVTLGSRGDWYYPGVITSTIDIFVPDLVTSLTKTVTDDDGGLAHPGDTLTYDLTFKNTADDAAVAVQLTDAIPAGLSYVPNSLTVVSGDNPGPKSDAVDADTASITGSTLTFNVGTGATGTTGGRVAPSAATDYHFRFKTTVDAGTESTTISNTANVAYDGETIGDSYTGSASADIDVEPLADVRLLSKTDNVDPATAGSATPVVYTLDVGNFGPSMADDVEITDTLPAGVTYVDGSSDARCDETSPGSGVVFCDLGSLAALAPGTTETVAIAVTVDEGVSEGQLGNRATVSTSTTDTSVLDDSAGEKTAVIRSADVAISKAATPTPNSAGNAVAGGQVSYLVTVNNLGPSSATNVEMADALPAGTSFVSATPSGSGSCTQPGTVNCAWSTLAAGASETVTIVVAIDPDADAGTLANTATVDADEDDPVGGNNRATESIGLVREIDLVTTKANVAAPAPGENVLYALAVTNNGPSSARNTSVVDDLPPEVTFVPALSSSGCTLSSAPSEVTCTLGTVQPGETVNVTIGAGVPADLADGTELVNTASATADEGTSPVAEDRVDAERQVDLSLVKSADADPVSAGANLTYTLGVANAGPSDSDGATIVDTLPAGVTFLAGSSDARCSGTAPTITCNPIDVSAGGSDTVTIAVAVSSGVAAGSDLLNSATISGGPGEDDANGSNNTGAVTTQVERTSSLQVTKSDSLDPVTAGTSMSWTVSVVNYGPSVDGNVVLTDTLPAGVDFVSATGPCSETSAGSNVVTCSFGSLTVAPAAGSSATTTITVDVDSDVANGTVLTNTASADGDASSPTTGSEQTTVAAAADLRLAKSAPASVNAGDPYSYVITVSNDGPSDASGVVVTDILPPELTPESWAASAGFATCSGTPLRCVPGSFAADGVVAAGDSVTITVDVQSDPATSDGFALVNKASVESDQPDPDDSDNVVSASTSAQRSADLAITKSNPNGPTPAGGTLTYDINVDNLGPSQATLVTVTDPVPAGLTFNAAASTSGCSLSGPNVVCSIAALDPADPPAAFSLVFDVSPALSASTLTNTASVSAVESDPVAGNDQATDQTTIYNEADLTLVKSSSAAPVVPGQSYQYDLVVTNSGPSNAVDTVVVDTLPVGTSFVAATSDGRCSAVGSTVTCNLGTLPPTPAAGHQDSFSITVATSSDLTGTVTNSATATSDTNDPTTADNTDTDSSTAVPQADLQLAKAVSPDPVIAGQTVAYTLTASNAGPSDVASFTITDTLPVGMTFVAAGSDTACTAAGQVVTCTDSTAFSPTATARTFTVVASVGSDIADGLDLVNNAKIASAHDDPDESNNGASAKVGVSRISDLGITKSATDTAAVAGDTVEFVLSVTNHGPSDATGITISDTLPADIVPTVVTPSGSVSCNISGQTISCGGPALAASASFDVTVKGAVAPSTPDNTAPLNVATVEGIETDTNTTNDGDTASVDVSRQSDLRLTKTSDAQPTAVAGATHLFEIEVANIGLSDSDNVVVTDTLPTGTSFHSPLSSSVCTEPTVGTVSCSIGNLPAGAVADLVVAVLIDASIADTTELTNTATVSGASVDIDETNNDDSLTVEVGRVADLAVVKQGPTAPVDAGDQVQFSLIATNFGPSDASAITVIDTLPTGLTFVSGAPTDSRCTAVGQTVTCSDGGPLAPGSASTFVVAAISSASLPEGGVLTNRAEASADEQDPNSNNDESSVVTDFSRSSDLTVTKVDTADPVVAGESITYTITALNDGPSVAANAVVTETLPSGATYNDALSDSRCDETSAGSGVVTCALGTLAVGAGNAQTLDIVATLDDGLVSGAQLNNLVALAADSGTPASSTEETTVNREVDLLVTKTLTTNPVVAGRPISWTVTVDNNGPSTATDVVLTDILPIGLTNVTTNPGPLTCAVTGAVVMCNWSEVPAGGQVSVTISADVESWVEVGSDVTNGATVVANESELNAADNVAVAAASTIRQVDLSVVKTAQSSTINAGEAAVWLLDVSNAGPSYASSVNVVDQLPANVTFNPTASSPACTEATAGSGLVTCLADALPDGQSLQFTIATDTTSTLGDGLTLPNTATVTADEPNSAATTTSTDTIVVATAADLAIDKTISTAGLRAGLAADYGIQVSNAGPSQAADVVVTDTLPDGLSFQAETSDSRCTVAAAVVTCSLGDLAVGEVAAFTIGVDVASDATGTLTNAAVVAATTTDPDESDNRSAAPGLVERTSAYELTKVGPATATQGDTIEWTVTATNLGPATGTAQIIDQLPSGLELVSSTTPDGVVCTEESNGLVCDTPELAVGESLAIQLETKLTGSGQVTNTAMVAGQGSVQTQTASADVEVIVGPDDLAFTGSSTIRMLKVAFGLSGIGVLLILGRRKTRRPNLGT